MGNNKRKGGVSRLSKSFVASSSKVPSAGTKHRDVVASRTLAHRRSEVDRHRREAVACKTFVLVAKGTVLTFSIALWRKLEQRRRENAECNDFFGDFDFMDGLDIDDLLEMLDDEPMDLDEAAEGNEAMGAFDGSEFIAALKRRKSRYVHRLLHLEPSFQRFSLARRKYNREEQRQRKKRRAENWAKLYPDLVNSYLAWSSHGAPDASIASNDTSTPRHEPIRCFDLHGIDFDYIHDVDLWDDFQAFKTWLSPSITRVV